VARPRNQGYLLREAPNRQAKPRVVGVRYACANDAPRDLSLIRAAPRNTPRTDVIAELDEALSGKLVQVEL
jgi:hypothetical protein